MNDNDFKVRYYTQNGTIRRIIPKARQSKKERLKRRWEDSDKERFPKTGRGNANIAEVELVKNYLRRIHPETARKMDIAKNTGLGQD